MTEQTLQVDGGASAGIYWPIVGDFQVELEELRKMLVKCQNAVLKLFASTVCALMLSSVPVLSGVEVGSSLDVSGEITSLNDIGTFKIDGSEYYFRLYGVELVENFPQSELVGQLVTCYDARPINSRGFNSSKNIVAVYCRFHSLHLFMRVGDELLDRGLATKFEDREGNDRLIRSAE